MSTGPVPEDRRPGPLPAVSVVMPARNEASTIERAVDSVLSQDYPGELELIVAEAGSEDGTRELLDRIAASRPELKVVDNPSGTTPAGLNAAIRAAAGEVIVRCDAHASLPPGYVRTAVELLLSTGADNVGGVQWAVGTGLLQRAIALAMTSPAGVGDARFHIGGRPGPTDTVYLGVFRRDVFERIGYFDEELLRSQDSELNDRIRAAGGTVYFHPDLRVVYTPRDNLRDLWRQYWSSGTWKREVLRRHASRPRLRQLAPPALVAGLVVSALLILSPWRGWALVLPVAYAGFLLLSALALGLRRREPAALLLPVVLVVMHLAWGAGLLLGPARR